MRPWLPVLLGLLALAGRLPAQGEVDYLRDVKPLLRARCYACHGALKQKARLRLDTGDLLRKGGRHGAAVKLGDPAGSLLLARVSDPDEATRMPPEGKPLTAQQVALLRAWIARGAPSPAGERPESDPRSHWAFQKPVRPPVPPAVKPEWARNPIDAFLARDHDKRGLSPRPAADRAVLLRRVYVDLIGVPPTRQELHAFLADVSPGAYERVVDRLLASPRYAERWARHWMDVWRYSDWYGRRAVPDVLNSYAMIWRWRDWIVRSVEDDRGYDWMVREMLAADETDPADDANLVATGFIVRNFFRWNYDQWKKDLVEHTGKAFLGLTLNCCQCHDHKYDPITQEEYFKFRAFFEPLELRHDRVPGEPDPGPYPKYEYAKSYGPIKSGMVRVFDANLDAPTFMYARGDARNRIPGKPPVWPGVPAVLGGRLDVRCVELPPTAWYPGLKLFVRRDEVTARRNAVRAVQDVLHAARAALASAEKQLREAGARAIAARQPLVALVIAPHTAAVQDARDAAGLAEAQAALAEADLAALDARIAADRARYTQPLPQAEQRRLARAARKAERRLKLESALLARIQAAQALARARRTPANPKATVPVAQLERQLAAVTQQAEQARKVYADNAGTAYTPLGPVYPSRSTGRRAALARWITSRDNPLAARVAVNHIWAWHFGRPLVATTYDFGRNGKPPSHPELLDWLAVEFMENGWHVKPLHRLIVTSTAYRMASDPGRLDNPNRQRDRDNRFLWHFPAARMEAEAVRDSVLYLAGELDPTRGGPELPHEQGLTSRRRSLYFAHHGEGKMQFLELFDGASACDCYKRSTSVVPSQALAMSNSELTLRHSRILARRLWQEVGPRGEQAFIEAAFEQVLGRPPSAAEKATSAAFLSRQVRLFREGGLAAAAGAPPDVPSSEPAMRAREGLVHALFNHNDFVTVR
jgi:hypothetical protein